MTPLLNSLTYRPTGCRQSILQAFDLSNSRSLRSLEIEIPRRCGGGMGFLRDLLSTVISPVFSDVVIVLPDNIIRDPEFLQNTLFKVVRDMGNVKPFRLVFRLGKCYRDGDDWKRLKEMIGAQAAEGGFGPFLHPLVIVPYTRAAQSVGIEHLLDHDVGVL